MRKWLIFNLLFVSCMAPMLNRESRQAEYIVTTNLPAQQSYDRALLWFTKNLGNANFAIQLKDPEQKRIVVIAHINVNEGMGMNTWGEYRISFTIDFQAKDERARVQFTDVKKVDMKPTAFSQREAPTTQEEMNEIANRYLIGIRDSIMKGLLSGEKEW